MNTKSNPHGIKVGQQVWIKKRNYEIERVKVLKVGSKYFYVDYPYQVGKIELDTLKPKEWPESTIYEVFITINDYNVRDEKVKTIISIRDYFNKIKPLELSIETLREIKKLAGI